MGGRVSAIVVVLVLALVWARVTSAEPSLEASGFIGFGWFSDRTELGNSWAPEQVPNTAPIVGGRVGWLAVPSLLEVGRVRMELAIETELSIATAFTGGATFSGDTSRMSYFAPVFGWRAHAALRFAGSDAIRPHLVAGVGGETIASSSPFMSKETDPVVYWGPGVAIPVSDRWLVRFDLRHGIMAARDDGMTSTLELQLGVGGTFGTPLKRVARPRDPDPVITDADADTDGDGIPDRLDVCPTEREIVNGVDDGDGCAELDPDGDGIIADADACPDSPEDFDRFADQDGCPEADNDGDSIDDARDACPMDAETRNGFSDDDGCPDVIPDDVAKTLVSAGAVKFEPNRARVTAVAKTTLQPLLALLVARSDLRITIAGRPEGKAKDNGVLAKRRAEAVKWYLVDEGITEDRIDTITLVGSTAKPILELTLTTK